MNFEKEWLSHFANNISKSLLRKKVIGNGNFLWHIFSWNIVDRDKCLIGDSARKAFDLVDKYKAIYFCPWDDSPSVKTLEKEMGVEYIEKFKGEIYVVAFDWSWTYMKTHEEGCGPYFYRL